MQNNKPSWLSSISSRWAAPKDPEREADLLRLVSNPEIEAFKAVLAAKARPLVEALALAPWSRQQEAPSVDQDNFIRGQVDMIRQIWILVDRAESAAQAAESAYGGNNLTARE